MKEKLILISCVLVLAILTVGVIFYKPNITPTTNTITTNTEEISEQTNIANPEDVIDSNFTFIYSSAFQELSGIKSNGEIIKLTNYAGAFKNFDVYKGNLYYLDTDYKLHVMKLDDTLEDTVLNLQLSEDVWDIHTNGEKLITFAKGENFYQEIYDIKTGEKELLPIVNNNQGYLYNTIYYYTSREDNSLCGYNINTKEINKISENGRILLATNNILYYAAENKLYKYDLDTNKTTNLEVSDKYFNVSQGYTITDTNIYLLEFHTLYTHTEDGKLTKLIDLKNKDYDSTELSIYTINNNELLIVENCLTSNDAPEGYGFDYMGTNSYIYNIENNTLEKTENNGYKSLSDISSLDIVFMK